MKNIAIIPNPKRDKELSVTKRISEKILSLGINVYVDKKYADVFSEEVKRYETFPEKTDLIIVVGGDGSILDASVVALAYDVPLVGVNLGKVGYLSEVEPDNLDLLDRLVTNKYTIEEKMLLTASHVSGDKVIKVSDRLAVNDVIISRANFSGMADITLGNGAGDSVRYRADGLVLSTPAGSTAYSLSSGGPIVSHDIDSIAATPICPHSFFNRSIIFKANERLTVRNNGDSFLDVSVDGRCFSNIAPGEKCVINMAEKKLKVLAFRENNMFSTLFKKMRILEDIQ